METALESLSLSPALVGVVRELGFQKFTPVQAQAIPVLLKGRDLIGQSKTGSGKTAAFTLPVLQKLQLEPRRIQTLILSPTRELCAQVAREVRKLGRKHPGLQVLVLSGGMPMFPQLTALEKGVHIVVGTPGRVLDHLRRGSLDLSTVTTLVLDEADRMLEMGFQEDMETILEAIPEERQTVFFSATFPRTIESMSRAYQRDPVRVTIAEESAPDIQQQAIETARDDKIDCLLCILQQHQPQSAIVFCNLKATVADVAAALRDVGVSQASLHGDLEQADRDRVMAKFRNRSTQVLVATDVAARGIDVSDLDLVVNFDLPNGPEVYVHRIGRTGRAGKQGLAISLMQPNEQWKIAEIEKYTQQPIELTAAPEMRPGPILAPVAAMETLYISGGRKDKVRPGDVLGALTGEAGGISASQIGKIEIHDRFTYVAVAKDVAPGLIVRLRDGRIKGRKFQIERVR
jgi:ATP-independent RNA helicase DbpA